MAHSDSMSPHLLRNMVESLLEVGVKAPSDKEFSSLGLNWAVCLKCPELTFVVIWRHINKTELDVSGLQRSC